MLVQIDTILSNPERQAIADAVADPAIWRDGTTTAKGEAKRVKQNLQANPDNTVVRGVVSKIEAALLANPVFVAAAQPESLIRLTLNRYDEGMAYGDHVDAPYIHGKRTDLSFTVFLSDPNDYEGGALTIDNGGHEDAVKGPGGSVVLYPSTSVHRVEAVHTGTRLACVGWVKSRIRSGEERHLIFELERIIADLQLAGTPLPTYNRLLNLRNNLLRAFGD